MKEIKEFKEIISDMSCLIESSGLGVSNLVAELVLKAYFQVKKDTLLSGDSIMEEGVGITSPGWRKIGNTGTTMTRNKGYTSKLTVELDSTLKDNLDNALVTDDLYRSKLGAADSLPKKGE